MSTNKPEVDPQEGYPLPDKVEEAVEQPSLDLHSHCQSIPLYALSQSDSLY